jgi:hypothetical protein
MAGKTALLLGSTGETGKELLRDLVHSTAFNKVQIRKENMFGIILALFAELGTSDTFIDLPIFDTYRIQ